MKHLARAVVEAFTFLELSDNDQVDVDEAVRAMEMLSATLGDCSPEELTALRTAAAEALHKAKQADANLDTIYFLENFMTNLE